ncbi:hypothetical protein BDP27DRAFT_1359008 [Rhodocollybia butyracea]|uniref:Uncharacterized protein n=1 Tax=Rhodocollybia butyracea TaxID=206335 RepID=A0A9P5Q7Y0_9AGAR|nr:hypothetical protein BDP27DRAFT_1359008 [Rhodocollybia butyracea]
MNMGLESSSVLAKILHNCPSLKSLSLESKNFVDDSIPHLQGTWYNITSLAIVEVEHNKDVVQHISCAKMVFSSFRFPSLNEVVVKDLELVAALRVMPSILHLDIENTDAHPSLSPITSRLMSSLRHQSASFSLAPKLHSLRLISKCKVPFDDSIFIEMVESRWFKPGSDLATAIFSMGKACIRSIVLKISWREVDAKVYQLLQNLDAEGLRVVVAGTNGVQLLFTNYGRWDECSRIVSEWALIIKCMIT